MPAFTHALRPLLTVLVLGTAGSARAFPYLAERLTGSALTGPTDSDLTALFYNPAALRLLSGGHVQIDAGVDGTLGSYQRATPLPAGFAGPGNPNPSASTSFQWPAPISFAAASWDLGSRTVSLAVSFSIPYQDFSNFPGSNGDGQNAITRYHLLRSQLYTLQGAAGAALKITDSFYLGGVFNFAWTRAQLRLFRDAAPGTPSPGEQLPCGTGCEQLGQQQDMNISVSGWGYGFSTGFLILLSRLWIGVGYVSPLFTSSGAQLYLTDAPPTPQTLKAGTPCPGGFGATLGACIAGPTSTITGGAALITAMPHILHLGVRRQLSKLHPRMEFTGALRITIPPRTNQELRLERPQFPDLPSSIFYPRGQQTAVAIDLGVRQHWHRLTLAEALLYESPRADPAAVSPGNLEGNKLNLTVTAKIDLSSRRWTGRRLWLVGSVGATAYIITGNPGSGFQAPNGSSWAGGCRSAGLDLQSNACVQSALGWDLPPATGAYQLYTLQGTLGLNAKL